MAFDIVDDGSAGLHRSDIRIAELLAAKDGIDTPTDGARQRIVEDDVDGSQRGLGIYFAPLGDLATKDACKVADGDARVGVGIVDDDGETVVGNGYCAGQILTVAQVLLFLRREVTRGKGQPRLELHEPLDGILLVHVFDSDGVEALAVEIEELLVEDGKETLVGHECFRSLLVSFLQFRIRLVPTSGEQA